jgi:hypothetical protein
VIVPKSRLLIVLHDVHLPISAEIGDASTNLRA